MCRLCLFSFLPLKKGEELHYAVHYLMMHANAVHLLVAFVDKATLAFKVVEVFYFNPMNTVNYHKFVNLLYTIYYLASVIWLIIYLFPPLF